MIQPSLSAACVNLCEIVRCEIHRLLISWMIVERRKIPNNSWARSNSAGKSKLSRLIKKVIRMWVGKDLDGNRGYFFNWGWTRMEIDLRRSLAVLCSPTMGENN